STWARFKSRLHLPDRIGFSKLPVSSMLGLFVPTNTVSRRKQTWTVRLLRTSRSRNAISLRSPAQSRPLRYMSMLRVPPSDCCLSKGKTWPSRCSPGLKRSPSWPGNTRSAGSSSINRCIPPRRLSAKPSHPQVDPTTSSSTCRSPRLGCGNWSWAKERKFNNCPEWPKWHGNRWDDERIRSSRQEKRIRTDSMYSPEIERTMRTFFAVLSERDRRLYAAVEASRLGHGGICYIASVLGCCERTIRRGLDELRQPSSVSLDRIRRKGGGASVVFNP